MSYQLPSQPLLLGHLGPVAPWLRMLRTAEDPDLEFEGRPPESLQIAGLDHLHWICSRRRRWSQAPPETSWCCRATWLGRFGRRRGPQVGKPGWSEGKCTGADLGPNRLGLCLLGRPRSLM